MALACHTTTLPGEVQDARRPLVLMVHGYLDGGRSFQAVVDALHDLWDGPHTPIVVCADLRGHGDSRPMPAGASAHLLDHAKDLSALSAAVCAAFGRVRLDAMVGHSLGGNVALMVCGARSDVAQRLVLLDIVGPPSEPAAEQPARLAAALTHAQQPLRPFKPAADLDAAIARLQRANPHLTAAGAARMAEAVLEPAAPGTPRAFRFDPRVRGPVPWRFEEAAWLALCAAAPRTSAVLCGSAGYVPLGDARVQARLDALGCVADVLDGVGHHVHVDAPRAVARVVRDVLARG